MQKFFPATVLAAVLLLQNIAAQADTGDLGSQRDLFLQLFSQARNGNYDDIQNQAQALRGYPLYPYLEAADLDYRQQRHSSTELDARIAAFLKRNPDLGAADGLRARWLADLGDRGEWKTLLDNYQSSEDAQLRCYHLTARIKLGRTLGMETEARDLWLVGARQPDACDPLFDWMEEHGLLTRPLIEQRMHLAMDAGETSVVEHLAKKLPDSMRRGADRWRDLQRRPVDTLQDLAQSRDPNVDAFIMAYGLRKAAHADSTATSKLFPQLVRLYSPTPSQRDGWIASVGTQLAMDHDPAAPDWFGQLRASPADQTAREWRIRSAIYQGDWAMAKTWIQDLPANEKTDDRWRYWLARSLEASGTQQAQQAKSIYAELAAKRGYYPYLAADRIGKPYTLLNLPVPADPETRQQIEESPSAIRAHELYVLNLLPQAKTEWNHFTRALSPLDLRQAAAMAHEWGWHYEAILTLVQADYWDDLNLRYPLLFRDEVLASARTEAIDPSWVYGIMRTESLFQPDARSSANAIGLLQLLPGTARLMARRIGMSYGGNDALLNPRTNIRLGAAYLHDMLQKLDSNYALATAAYNAGPNRVRQWLPARALPADVWVENIPFNETRGYVQRVMEHATAFEWRLGRATTTLAQRMPPINPAGSSTP